MDAFASLFAGVLHDAFEVIWCEELGHGEHAAA